MHSDVHQESRFTDIAISSVDSIDDTQLKDFHTSWHLLAEETGSHRTFHTHNISACVSDPYRTSILTHTHTKCLTTSVGPWAPGDNRPVLSYAHTCVHTRVQNLLALRGILTFARWSNYLNVCRTRTDECVCSCRVLSMTGIILPKLISYIQTSTQKCHIVELWSAWLLWYIELWCSWEMWGWV